MNQRNQDRIKIAEAMELLPDDFQGWGEYKDAIEKYDGEVLKILLALIPDPFTDANDCEAVISWLNENGYAIARGQYVNGRGHVHLFGDRLKLRWKGKNEDNGSGVCKLALRLIRATT